MRRFFNFLFLFFIFCILYFIFLSEVFSQEIKNNKFGIHLAQPHYEDLKKAAELVNSSGGDWGYITLVIQENDRSLNKWQEIFNQLRRLHLIPIIRLATVPEGEVWKRPQKEEIDNWVNFLNSLNWVIKKRHIILFNEPNHGSEWGGEVDPRSYADISLELAKKLKEKNQDFFIMLAGFDSSAPHQPPQYWDEELFLKEIFNYQPLIFDYLDGWASHSYPNPNFSSSPWDYGRGTIRGYQWEKDLLRRLGINKELPIFITETGWKRGIKLDELRVADYFKIAFENIWLPDNQVIAVTPFVFNYQGEPFLEFSWKKHGKEDFYQQYYTVSSIIKIKGEPEQLEKGEILLDFPKELISQSIYHHQLIIKNQGQGFWDEKDGYYLKTKSKNSDDSQFFFEAINSINPDEQKIINFSFKTPKETGFKKIIFILEKNGKEIIRSKELVVNIFPLPTLRLNINLFPKINDQGDDFEIQIFDKKENIVFNKQKIDVYGGKGVVDEVKNVIIGEKYRVVILKKYYLPRQNYLVFKRGENKINFKPMIPLDFDTNGKLSLNDFFTFIKKPRLISLFFL